MDFLAHALYGATVCSRSGLAGGRTGAGRTEGRGRRRMDWTVWAALAFGVLPDAVSMGPPFLAFLLAGAPGNFFHDLGGTDMIAYRAMHSLVVALCAAGALRACVRPLALPALAWPLHVVMDAVTHDDGKFGTTLLFPFSTWSIPGIRWWEHPGVVWGYWLALPVLWVGLVAWRRGWGRRTPGCAG